MATTIPRGKPVGRPRNADSEDRRERILDIATEIFARDGYKSTTMSAVARGCGLSQTGLLHHFPNKEDLLRAVMERRDARDWLKIDMAGTRARGWKYLENLITLVENNQSERCMLKLFTTLSAEAIDSEHPANRWLIDHHQDFSDAICQALSEAKVDGLLAEDAPIASMARSIMAVMDGLQVQWLVNDDYNEMKLDFSLFLSALRARWEA